MAGSRTAPHRLRPSSARQTGLLDPGCAACGRRAGAAVCPGCLVQLTATRPEPARLGELADHLGLDRLVALASYDGAARELVLAAKNLRRLDVGPALAPLLSAHLADSHDRATSGGPGPPPVVTWVPASPRGRRRRGYDHGRELARAVAHHCGLSARRLLARRGSSRHRNREERLEGPRLLTAGRAPPRLVVVDDVLTTGGSLAAAASALRRAGAGEVIAAVVAIVDDRSR